MCLWRGTLNKEIPRELQNLGTCPSPILPAPLSSLLTFGALQHLIGSFFMSRQATQPMWNCSCCWWWLLPADLWFELLVPLPRGRAQGTTKALTEVSSPRQQLKYPFVTHVLPTTQIKHSSVSAIRKIS